MSIVSKIEGSYRERSEEVAEKRGTVYKIVIYRDGKVSREVEEREYEDVLCNICIAPYYYNKKSRMLFCYDNGHVNIMTPWDLLNGKLRCKGLKSNGYNLKTRASLVKVIVCRREDYLVVCSYGGDGKKYIKAMPIEGRASHVHMDAAGNILVKDARPYQWLVVPKNALFAIASIVCKTTYVGHLQEQHRPLVEVLLAENAAAMGLSPHPVEQLTVDGCFRARK